MSGWTTAPLGELFEIGRGGSPRPISAYITDDPDGINWISISDASESSKYIYRTARRIKPSGISKSRMVREGDFLLTNSMSFGRPYIVKTTGCIHDGWLVLSDKKGRTDPDYLYHLLSSANVYRQFEKLAAGVTVKNLNIELVSGVEIPLPPLGEQRRIAAILDAADALRQKRRQALRLLDQLSQAIFIEMFGDPVENPLGWERVPFADLLENIDSGWSPTCLDRSVADGEWGVLKLGAVTYCTYDDAANKALPLAVEPDPTIEVRPGDLLFARKNTRELVGATAYVEETRPRLMMSDLIFRLRLKANAPISRIFLWQLLIHPSKRRSIQRLATGAAGSMPNISKSRLMKELIELPPLALQQKYEERIECLTQARRQARSSMEMLDHLFASLQHRAFRGEL